jgi:hypothetical protein
MLHNGDDAPANDCPSSPTTSRPPHHANKNNNNTKLLRPPKVKRVNLSSIAHPPRLTDWLFA